MGFGLPTCPDRGSHARGSESPPGRRAAPRAWEHAPTHPSATGQPDTQRPELQVSGHRAWKDMWPEGKSGAAGLGQGTGQRGTGGHSPSARLSVSRKEKTSRHWRVARLAARSATPILQPPKGRGDPHPSGCYSEPGCPCSGQRRPGSLDLTILAAQFRGRPPQVTASSTRHQVMRMSGAKNQK